MSREQISTLSATLSRALLEFAWDEWAQLGVLAHARGRSPWAQDPEALLLLTFEVAREDPRLFDEVLDWIIVNEALLSVRRLRALATDAIDARLVNAVMGYTARYRPRPRLQPRDEPRTRTSQALEPLYRGLSLPIANPDPAFAASGFARPLSDPSHKSRAPDPRAPINLAFRLRQLLGVGVRSEIVRALLTIDAPRASANVLAATTAFSKRNVQETLSALHLAGVVSIASLGSDRRYGLDKSRWATLLELDDNQLPAYRDWPQLLAALRRILRWAHTPQPPTTSDYLLASSARELLTQVADDLQFAGVSVPTAVSAAEAPAALRATIEQALGLLHTHPSPASDATANATIDITRDDDDAYYWQLLAPGRRVLARSSDAFNNNHAAEHAAREFLEQTPSLRVDVYHDADGGYRWRARTPNAKTLATSPNAFDSRATAQRAADHARAAATSIRPTRIISDVHTFAHTKDATMTNPNRRHITKRPDGQWQDKAEGATRAASIHRTQADAEAAAKQVARNQPGGAEVIVHRPDGRIRDTDTINRPDPNPPKDTKH